MLKENSFMRGELDAIQKFGSLDDIKRKIDISEQKEKKVNDLLDELELTNKSTENQLSCYSCMNLMQSPVVLTPCAHVVCKDCSKVNECPQCKKNVKMLLPCDLIRGLVDKFEVTKDAISTFKSS